MVVVMITLLATATPDYQPARFVFGHWINETGWPNGVAFILGLLQSTFGLTGTSALATARTFADRMLLSSGFDAIAHMVRVKQFLEVQISELLVSGRRNARSCYQRS